jgi:hypothetical protein
MLQPPSVRLEHYTSALERSNNSRNFARWQACLGLNQGNRERAEEAFLQTWCRTERERVELRKDFELETKAAVAAGSTTDAVWAKPLVGVEAWKEGFVQIARSASLLGRVDGLRQIPFNTKVPIETGAANYVWVGENVTKSVSAMMFDPGITLAGLKAATIVVFTRELFRLSSSGTDKTIEATLVAGLTAFTDQALLDPASTAIAGIRPASLTTNTVAIPSTGNLQVDVQSLITAFFAGRAGAQTPVLIAGGAKAAQLRAMQPGFGLPIFSSEGAGGTVVMLDPAGVFYADDGVDTKYSDQASVQMNSTPDAPPTAASVAVSFWQLGLIGIRVERMVNWAAVPNAVRYLAA